MNCSRRLWEKPRHVLALVHPGRRVVRWSNTIGLVREVE